MADEQLAADLELSIDTALNSVDALGSSITNTLTDSSDAFASAMEAAIAAIPEVQISTDTSEVAPDIAGAIESADSTVALDATGADEITAEIDGSVAAADSTVALDADTSAVDAALSSVDAEANSLTATIPLDADTSSIDTALHDVEAAAESIQPTIHVDADTSDAEAAVDDLGSTVDSTSSSMDTGSATAGEYGGALAAASVSAGLARGSTSELQGAVQGAGGSMGAAVGVGAAFAATLGVLYTKGVQSQGAIDRFNATLGESADASASMRIEVGNLDQDMIELGKSLGAGGRELRNAASSAYQFASVSGASAGEANKFTQTIIALASRAVALNPALGSVGDVAEQMQVRLARGGRFAARFGLDLNAAEISARALRDTGKSTAAELTIYEKAAAAAAIATEKYGDSLSGDIQRGSENAIIQQRRLEEQFNSILATLGRTIVIPMFDLIEAGLPVMDAFATIVTTLGATVIPILGTAIGAITPGLELLASLFQAIPGPVLAVVTALAALEILGPTTNLIYNAGFAIGRLQQMASTTGGKLAMAGAGALLAATGFQQAGEGGVKGAIGMGEMVAGGALLGAQLGALAGGNIAVGAALGATAGAVVGVAQQMTDSGPDVNEYRTSFEKLAGTLAKLNQEDAVRRFVKALGETDALSIAKGQVHGLDTELRILAETSPAAAQKVVEGLVNMNEAANTPLSAEQIIRYNQVVAQGTETYKQNTVEARRNQAADDALAASAMVAAQAETNKTVAQKANTDAVAAHSQALAQEQSAYQATTLAAQNQAVADANMVAVAQGQALASRSVADANAAVAQSHLSATIATDAAANAAIRFAAGQGTAKELTDAESASVQQLSLALAALEGNYLGSIGAGLSLQQSILQFNDTLNANNGTLGDNALKVTQAEQALVSMGNAAISASQAAAQNGESIQNQTAPLEQYQAELEATKQRLIETGDTAGAEFVQKLMDANQRAIDNLRGSEPGFTAAGQAAAGGAVNGAASQSGAMGAAGQSVGAAGASGLGSGMAVMAAIAGGSTADAVNSAAMAGATAHNIGYGIGAAFSEGIGDGIYANQGYVAGAARSIVDAAVSAARAEAKIGSPSRRFAREVGRPISQGVAVGIEQSSEAIDAAMRAALDTADVEHYGGRAYRPFAPPGIARGVMAGGLTINVDVAVNGVEDPGAAKRAGTNAGDGLADALIRRGIVVSTRVGG